MILEVPVAINYFTIIDFEFCIDFELGTTIVLGVMLTVWLCFFLIGLRRGQISISH